MDISFKYISMCKETIEVQKLWKPEAGDFVQNKDLTYSVDIVCDIYKINYRMEYELTKLWFADAIGDDCPIPYNMDEYIWLPRQDQLQDIWQKSYYKKPTKNGWFGEFVNWLDAMYIDNKNADESFDTMEELWLAFIICIKYDKLWDEKKWIEA